MGITMFGLPVELRVDIPIGTVLMHPATFVALEEQFLANITFVSEDSARSRTAIPNGEPAEAAPDDSGQPS